MNWGPWQAIVIGVPIGVVGSLLVLSGMMWLGTGEWRIWRIFRDDTRR